MEETQLNQPATHRRSILQWLGGLVVVAVSVAVILRVASPTQILHTLGNMSPAWLAAAVAFELVSCFSYPVVFRRFFPEPPRRVARQVAWISMGAGAVLPGGNFSSAAAQGWLLRSHGIGARRLAERCGAMLCFLTLFGFFVNGVAATLLLIGVGTGPHDLEHGGVPILVSLFVLGAAGAALILGRRHQARAPKLIQSVTTSLNDAWEAAIHPDWRLLGAVGFLLFDMAALWAACRATGHPVGMLAVAVAYFIGYLATMIPIPAGLGVLDSGLAGALVLYGFSPAAAVGAVLVYHAISVWIPGTGGLIAWLPTRSRPRAVEADRPLAERLAVARSSA